MKVGDTLPAFCGKNEKGFEITQEDVIGCLIIFFFFPAGNHTLLKTLQTKKGFFKKKQVLLIGVSDEEKKPNFPFDFTLLKEKGIAKSFGVLKEGKITQALFIIDAQGIIRLCEAKADMSMLLKVLKKYLSSHI